MIIDNIGAGTTNITKLTIREVHMPGKKWYGPELVTNGDFSIGWTAGNGAVISNGSFILNGGVNTTVYNLSMLEPYKKYKVKIDVSSFSGTNISEVVRFSISIDELRSIFSFFGILYELFSPIVYEMACSGKLFKTML